MIDLQSYLRNKFSSMLDTIFSAVPEPGNAVFRTRSRAFENAISDTVADGIRQYDADTVQPLLTRIADLENRLSILERK